MPRSIASPFVYERVDGDVHRQNRAATSKRPPNAIMHERALLSSPATRPPRARRATVVSPCVSPRPHPSCAYLSVSTPRKHPSPDAPVRRAACSRLLRFLAPLGINRPLQADNKEQIGNAQQRLRGAVQVVHIRKQCAVLLLGDHAGYNSAANKHQQVGEAELHQPWKRPRRFPHIVQCSDVRNRRQLEEQRADGGRIAERLPRGQRRHQTAERLLRSSLPTQPPSHRHCW
eukprot:ctg_669.g162